MQIGWAVADVTPSRPVMLRGQFHTRVSERVNDPVTATALAFEAMGDDGKAEQAVMVSCDRCGIPGHIHQRIGEIVGSELPDFDVGKLLLCATHTHTAPEIEEGFYPPAETGVMTPTEYADFFTERVAEAVVRAWNSRSPGGISWGFGHAVVGHNRRISYFGGLSRMYGSTDKEEFDCVEGYEDHGMDLLFTWDLQGQLTGLVLNLACPSQETEGESYVSADFWHEVRLELRKRHGEGLFVLPQCSAAGDQSPHLLLHRRAEDRMVERRGLSRREEIGRRIANAVDDVLTVAQSDLRTELPFKHSVQIIPLPARLVTEEEFETAARRYESLQEENPEPSDRAAVSQRFILMHRNKAVMDRYEWQRSHRSHEVEVHVLRLGDIALATNPFELFLDYGLRMKARSKALQTFVVQLAGSRTDVLASYLPTSKAAAAQGYGGEAVDSLVGPEGGQELVEKTVATINAMWE